MDCSEIAWRQWRRRDLFLTSSRDKVLAVPNDDALTWMNWTSSAAPL